MLITLPTRKNGPAALNFEQPMADEYRMREPTMTSTTLKLSKMWKNFLREENQQVIEFFLLLTLICCATGLAGLSVVSHVDVAFKNIGTTFHSYMR